MNLKQLVEAKVAVETSTQIKAVPMPLFPPKSRMT
jgi:hypothetical protein